VVAMMLGRAGPWWLVGRVDARAVSLAEADRRFVRAAPGCRADRARRAGRPGRGGARS